METGQFNWRRTAGIYIAALAVLGTPLTVNTAKASPTQSPAILESGFTNLGAPYPKCHASTIAETPSGQLVAAWFGGTHERNPDVCIWVSRKVNGKWTPGVKVADGIQKDGPRLPTWNPVLFQAPDKGPLILFYKVGPKPSEWWGMMMKSNDGGKTWGKAVRLPDGVLGPIKDKPVMLSDGTLLCGTSIEGTPTGWRVEFDLTRDLGKTWEVVGPVGKGPKNLDAIQPTILVHKDGRVQALCRTKNGTIAQTWSSDNGRSWTPLEPTELPNPNSGIDAVTLHDGTFLLVYNNSAPPSWRPTKGLRYPLDVALSKDGIHWRHVLVLDDKPCKAGYSYPAVIQTTDGRVQITYTWDRLHIKYVELDPSKLEQ